jgi:hypothetical protein
MEREIAISITIGIIIVLVRVLEALWDSHSY